MLPGPRAGERHLRQLLGRPVARGGGRARPRAGRRRTLSASSASRCPPTCPRGRVTIPFEVQAPRESGVFSYAWAIAPGAASRPSSSTPRGRGDRVRDSADCTRPGAVARFRAGGARRLRGPRGARAGHRHPRQLRRGDLDARGGLPPRLGAPRRYVALAHHPRRAPARRPLRRRGDAPDRGRRARRARPLPRTPGSSSATPSASATRRPSCASPRSRGATAAAPRTPVALRRAERAGHARPGRGGQRRHHLRQLRRRRVGRRSPHQRRRPRDRRALGRGQPRVPPGGGPGLSAHRALSHQGAGRRGELPLPLGGDPRRRRHPRGLPPSGASPCA